MLTERLQKRCPSAKFDCSAYVCGYDLRFSKRSDDCSGKATIVENNGSHEKLYGALFQIDKTELLALDKAEGTGYERRDDFVVVKVKDDQEIEVTTYIAKPKTIDSSLVPYHWYKNLVTMGARQAGLSDSYLLQLEKFDSVPDPITTRKSFIEAQLLLDRFDDPT